MTKFYKLPSKEKVMSTRGANLTKSEIIALGTRNREIAEMKREGHSYGEIARQFNLSREYVKELCHKQGVYGNSKPKVLRSKTLF